MLLTLDSGLWTRNRGCSPPPTLDSKPWTLDWAHLSEP